MVANLVMEDVEQRALNSFVGSRPLFWKHYVNTVTDLHENEVDNLHEHLNRIEPSFK